MKSILAAFENCTVNNPNFLAGILFAITMMLISTLTVAIFESILDKHWQKHAERYYFQKYIHDEKKMECIKERATKKTETIKKRIENVDVPDRQDRDDK